jgi:hypothetical protein
MDAMEGSVHRFAGALETFLGRIQIDDRLRLVPDTMRLAPAPHPSLQSVAPGTPVVLPTIRSVSPSTPLELPMDEDEDDVAVASSSAQDTRTTPSDVDTDIRMVDVAPIPTESATSPLGSLAPERAPIPPPTPTVVPATPQRSQDVAIALPTPALHLPIPPPTIAEVDSIPPPLARKRSRTPAAGLLGVEAPTTRARSRSKTPI